MSSAGVWKIALAASIAALVACGSSSDPGEPGPASDLTHPARTYIVPVPMPGAAYGVAISPSGIVYVTQISGNKVYGTTSPVSGFSDSVTVGLTPAHVAINPAGTRAFVTNQSSQSVSVVDMVNHTEIAAIPVGNDAFNLIVSPNGTRVYATTSVGTVYAINTASLAKVDSFAAGAVANGLAFSPNGQLLYVSSRDAGRVVVYNTASGDLVDSLYTGGMPQRMAVSEDGNELYIANEQLGIDIWNLSTRSRITSVAIEAYGLGLSPDNAHLYVSDPLHGKVRIVDRATRAVIDSILTAGVPRNIAFNRSGTEALITNEAGYVTVVR
jgi:YVTN family beta-propeller protein